jgi:hypothetical protein
LVLQRKILIWVLSGLLYLTAACQPFAREAKATQSPFVPPPPAQSSPTPAGEVVEPRQQATATCQDGLSYISDVTIPDGEEVQANATLDKRWEVKNSGNCNWDERYRLRLISGEGLSVEEEQMLYPARSGTQAILRIVFKAPDTPGSYRSAWQAYNPDGQAFGDAVFIDFVVKQAEDN